MNLSAPTIDIDCEATKELIKEVVPELQKKDNPYVILSKEASTFMQALWTEQGYILEYQQGSIDYHFISQEYLNASEIIEAFHLYYDERNDWQEKHKFYKKNFRGFIGGVGYVIGSFIGGFIRGVKESRSKKT